MGVIHREQGFRFVIFTDDHEPAHVHVFGSGEMRVRLIGPDGLPELMTSWGFKKSDQRKVLKIVLSQQADFLKRWIEIHGKDRQS
ncbi:MAG: DUF4160 domain-containing protein [Sphingopyxis sp.]|nr:DUF4160 domain-containing protein [Sphingopyxis sp.]